MIKININHLFNKLKFKLDSIFFFIFIFLIYSIIVFFSAKSIYMDYYAHIDHVVNINKGVKNYPYHFLFFFIVNILSCFSTNKLILYVALIFLLSFATFFKYIVCKGFVMDFIIKDIY